MKEERLRPTRENCCTVYKSWKILYETNRLASTVSALSLNTGAKIVPSPNIDFSIKCLRQKKKFTKLV